MFVQNELLDANLGSVVNDFGTTLSVMAAEHFPRLLSDRDKSCGCVVLVMVCCALSTVQMPKRDSPSVKLMI